MSWRVFIWILSFFILVSVAAAAEDEFDHEYKGFATVLSKHVSNGRVNYAALVLDRFGLDGFLKSMEKVDDDVFAKFTLDQKRAYWINFHNAMILRIVIDNYPVKQSDPFSKYPSNSPLNIQGAWTSILFKSPVGKVNLSRIENEILVALGEPAYVFALTNGMKGGPDLESVPFLAADLSKRLAAAAQRFLRDPERVKVDSNANALFVSKYLEMNRRKFVSKFYIAEQYRNRDKEDAALINLLIKEGDPANATFLRSGWFTINWLPVNESLNDVL